MRPGVVPGAPPADAGGAAWKRRVPFGINLGAGCAVVVVAAVIAAALPQPAQVWRVVVMAGAVILVGAVTADALATPLVAVVAFLVLDGFLVNRYGQISWHGMTDMYRLVVVMVSAGAGLAIATARRRGSENLGR
jgi:hypothetical protein